MEHNSLTVKTEQSQVLSALHFQNIYLEIQTDRQNNFLNIRNDGDGWWKHSMPFAFTSAENTTKYQIFELFIGTF